MRCMLYYRRAFFSKQGVCCILCGNIFTTWGAFFSTYAHISRYTTISLQSLLSLYAVLFSCEKRCALAYLLYAVLLSPIVCSAFSVIFVGPRSRLTEARPTV